MRHINKRIINLLPYIILTVIVGAGLLFRIAGVKENHSFWADEAFVSSFARDIAQGEKTIIQGLQTGNLNYQPLHIITLALFFKVFGISEMSVRLSSVIMGTLGIVVAFLLGKRLSNTAGGLLASFLYAFAQLNLANSTQAKQYTALQTLLLMEIYLLSLHSSLRRKWDIFLHLVIVSIASAASLLNFIGYMLWIPYGVFLITKIRWETVKLLRKPLYLIAGGMILAAGIWVFQVPKILYILLDPPQGSILMSYNNTTYLRELFWRQYAFITLPAFFGFAYFLRTSRWLHLSILFTIALLLYFWNFRQYSHNVRYLLPIFGIVFVYFGVFWSLVGERVFRNKSALICFAVAIALFLGGYKIVRKPSSYYTPNADLFGDVQIADYKDLFRQLTKRYPDSTQYVLFINVIDALRWYLPEKNPEATFVKHYAVGRKYGDYFISDLDRIPAYTSLDQFIKEKGKYQRGILIVEDWESLLPEEIKQYAKKNMKREIRIEGLPQAKGDNWPLEVYSWGMD